MIVVVVVVVDYSTSSGSYVGHENYAILFFSRVSTLTRDIYTVFQKKTCDHVFDDKLKKNCRFRKIFGKLITKSTSHRQVFLFSHLTYFVQLLYLGKL